MQIAQNKVVGFNYTVKDAQSKLIDSNEGGQPLEYIHGTGGIIPGVEAAIEGKSEGESLKIVVTPDKGYGQRNDQLIQRVPRSNFDGIEKIEVGMQFQARTPQGARIVTVVGVDDKEVTVDANHPLAGQTLHFDVTIVSVRDARPEELEHGHACNHEGGCASCGGH